MSINVNINVARAIERIQEESLTLVIFKNAKFKSTITEKFVRVNTVDELIATFNMPEAIGLAALELYSAEYLLMAGVNLLCYEVDTVGEIKAADITLIKDIEVLNYKMVVSPYNFLTTTNKEPLLLNFVKENDVQLFMDLEYDEADAEAVITGLDKTVSPKLELSINAGLPTFKSKIAGIPADFEDDFIGVPASLLAVVRKAKYLDAETPWLPVAGETHGMINELIKLKRELTTVEKTALQAKNVNVLTLKKGVGIMFVSQNTMVADTDSQLVRSHVVTEALWFKRKFTRIAESIKFTPNNSKTWNIFRGKASSLFREVLKNEGIEEYHVAVGLGTTMTKEDIQNGIFKAFVSYLPIRLVESIVLSVVIQVEEGSYDIQITSEGGL